MAAATTGQSGISAAHLRTIAHTARKAFGPGPIELWSLACTTPAKSKERRRAPRFDHLAHAGSLVNGQLSMMTTSPHLSIGTRRGLRCAFMISLEDCVALSGLTEGQDPPATSR